MKRTARLKSVVVYASHLNKIGGVETFTLNFCKRLRGAYDITFAYDTCEPSMLDRIGQYVKCVKLADGQAITPDVLILSTAWGRGATGRISAPMQIQMVHADYLAYIENWNFKYTIAPGTTHHVAVSNHVAKQFEIATPYKIDAVIYNLL